MKRMKHKLLQVLFTLMLIISFSSQASVVEDLYTVELAVADQTTSLRLDAFKQAFRDVIIKVSGSEDALKVPGMARPLKSSARYVHQFRYILRKDDNAESFDNGQLFLRVTFNQDAVESLLRSNNISIWGKERPSTLLLISYEINKSASIISSDTTPELVDELDVLAQKRGLPVLFPLLDLEDRQQFGVQDIIESNADNIAMAAARYSPDAVLLGQISGRAGKGWQGQWQAQFSGRRFDWTFSAGSREQVLTQAVDQLAKLLAKEYALQSSAGFDQEVLFSVDHVNRLEDHVRVLSYLQSLDAIESVRLVLIEQDRLSYRVKLRNTRDDLSRLISLGSVLEQLELPQIDASSSDQTIMMNYRLLR